MSDSFHTPRLVSDLLSGFQQPWFIAGGWAVDLFLGRVTREHEDLEIAILRDDQMALRDCLKGWRFQKLVPRPGGGRREPWPEGEWLSLPVHELHAVKRGATALEVLLNESSGGQWRFRRNPEVTLPLASLGLRSQTGPPILAPEIVLLYKAKQPRQRDEDDFRAALPALNRQRRAWLSKAIDTCHPGHTWLAAL